MLLTDITDHCAIFVHLGIGAPRTDAPLRILYRLKNDECYEAFRRDCCGIDWDSVFVGDLNDSLVTFERTINDV